MKIQTIVVSAAFISLALAFIVFLMSFARDLWLDGSKAGATSTALLAITIALFTLSCFL